MMLEDDRKRYAMGDGVLSEETLKGMNENPAVLLSGMTAAVEAKQREYEQALKNNDNKLARSLNDEINSLDEQRILLQNKLSERGGMKDGGPGIEALRKEAPEVVERMGYQEGGSLLQDDRVMMEENEMPTHTMPDGTVMPGATHEEGEVSMEEPEMESETPMESDSEMEDNYLDFIIDEALSEEEEDMLMSKLEQDEELSMLFDKVIEVASEFAGSGPVEGPGTGVSDSIPARLSDGEFVFTAKAVEEIGADNLMAMMKEAEMKADERQGMANGGPLEEERVVLESTQEPVVQKIEVAKETVDETARPIQDTGEQELSMSLRANMLDPSKRYVRS